jgi:hypothetical protein
MSKFIEINCDLRGHIVINTDHIVIFYPDYRRFPVWNEEEQKEEGWVTDYYIRYYISRRESSKEIFDTEEKRDARYNELKELLI